jgi:mannose-1-phosphate guanylyltransferase
MLPIGGQPLLHHLVRWLRAHGVGEIAINLHHKPEAITEYFGRGERFEVAVTYSHERQLLGTAGALKKLQAFFDETFVVLYGDVFTNIDLTRLLKFHHDRVLADQSGLSLPSASGQPTLTGTTQPALTLSLYRVANPSVCGLVELNGRDRITRFVEKPPPEAVFTDLANAGVMVFEPGILDYIPDSAPVDLGYELFPRLLDQGIPLYGYPLRDGEFLIDIGTPESYHRAQELAAGCSS